MSTLNGQRLVRASVHIPPSGGGWADVSLEQGALPSGKVTLRLGDFSFVGGVDLDRTGFDQSASPRVVVRGGAGWEAKLTAPGAYTSAGNVRLSTVLRDLAALATYTGGPSTGEAYDAPPEALLGPGYGWDASTDRPIRARDVLADLVRRGAIPTWRVDPATGHTRFDAGPAGGACDPFVTIIDRDRSRGVRYLGLTEAVKCVLPGNTVEGATIERVDIIEDARELRAQVWTTRPSVRTAVRNIVTDLFPWVQRIGIAASGALAIRSQAGRTEIEGPDNLS
ncbi:MAG TPA: hypothetical protein VLT61_13395, partial [Anaeromyxobacteraceae bacterium]|nr:hypothetical protein [Anaeromyxobacteraceae bacterium]